MTKKHKILLNSDLGEAFGTYSCGNDEEIIKYVDCVNIACGMHAGDPVVMEKTIRLADCYDIKIGAHPGYPDLQGFGRRDMNLSPHEIYDYVVYQIGALSAFCKAYDHKLFHVKPHGQLYNRAAKDQQVSGAIVAAIIDAAGYDTKLIALAGSELAKKGKECGLDVLEEFFVDRNYTNDGTLVPRSQSNAVIHDEDEAISRIKELIQTGYICSISGEKIEMNADTICVHGDTPEALSFVKKIKRVI